MDSAFVKTTLKNEILSIRFYNSFSNSLTSVQLHEIAQAIQDATDNKDVKVLLIESEGEKVFCAGASFDELLQIDNLENATKFFMGFANVINTMIACPKLIVTKVQGKTVGGGVGIIAASDVVFAHESASLKLSELSIGIGPFVIEPIISHKIGKVHAAKMAYQPVKWHSASWSEQVGLFTSVFNNHGDLEEELNQYLEKLVGYHGAALDQLKKVFQESATDLTKIIQERAKISGSLLLAPRTKQYLKQFKTK